MSDIEVTAAVADRSRDLRVVGQIIPPAGTPAGNVLTATPDGSSWQAPASGLPVLFDETLVADAAALDTGTGGIPQTSSHLLLLVAARSTRPANTFDAGQIQFNGDTAGNYYTELVTGVGTSVTAAQFIAATALYFEMPASTATAGLRSNAVINLLDYRSTFLKLGNANGGYAKALSASNLVTQTFSYTWNNTAAINRVRVFAQNGNLAAGSRMTIYGLP